MYKLRELRKTDMPKINEWRNDSELIAYLGASFRYINLDVEYLWYENYMSNRNNTVRCVIVDAADDENALGLVSLTDINTINQTADFHIMIGDTANRGKGIGQFATNEMLNHAFNNLNLHRVELEVLESNLHARNLYKKVGFVQEGIKRQSIYKNGRFVDMITMAILKEDFSSIR